MGAQLGGAAWVTGSNPAQSPSPPPPAFSPAAARWCATPPRWPRCRCWWTARWRLPRAPWSQSTSCGSMGATPVGALGPLYCCTCSTQAFGSLFGGGALRAGRVPPCLCAAICFSCRLPGAPPAQASSPRTPAGWPGPGCGPTCGLLTWPRRRWVIGDWGWPAAAVGGQGRRSAPRRKRPANERRVLLA